MKTLAGLWAVALLVAGMPAWAQTGAQAMSKPPVEDKYVGYYYPKPNSTETFTSQLQSVAGVDRTQRVQFVTVVSQGTLQSTYRVPYAVFAKGDRADHLIIVGMQGGELDSIYRIRALLANMTTMARLSPFFQEHTVAEDATFFDLLKLLSFRDITVTDGEKLTHQVTIK